MLITSSKSAGFPVAIAFVLAISCWIAGAFPSPAEAKSAPKPTVAVTIVDAGQKPMVNRGVLPVKVRSARKGKLWVRGFSSTFDGKDLMKPLTVVARPRFKRAGQWRTIKLKLNEAGKAAVATCQDRELQVKAGAVRSNRKSMLRQIPDCRPGALDMSRASSCDFIAAQDPRICMSPFPDNYYTLADPETASGRRINFSAEAMPANKSGRRIDPGPYLASDGFSQGQTISVRVPGLDNPTALARTNPVGLSDPSRFLDGNAPVIVLDARTRERQPIWVEIDAQAGSPASTSLLIHPMVNFDPATRYLVVLRNLKDSAGSVLKAPAGFRFFRDFLRSSDPRINGRRTFYEDIFRRLRAAGIRRSNLYLAWDFTTASDESNSGRARSMRDQAFAGLGDNDLSDRKLQGDAPEFRVDSVETNVDAEIARRIEGTFEVPCYLRQPSAGDECGAGATMNLDPDGKPRRTGTYEAGFECLIPRVLTDPGSVDPGALPDENLRGRALLYGHDLLGSIDGELANEAQRKLATRGFTICGTDQIGLSNGDESTLENAFGDLSAFPQVADRLQQALLNEMLLARLMIHPGGLDSRAAFRVDPLASDPSRVPGGDGNATVPPGSDLEPAIIAGTDARAWYRGVGEGGITGGALIALAPDIDRGSLGSAAMNHSVLISRSGAWDRLRSVFDLAYPNGAERPLALGLIQMLWDRAEANGYAHRMTGEPLPDSPTHRVLFDLAFGDHQVTNWQSNVEARTIGARAIVPFISSGRWPGVDVRWGMDPVSTFPYDGSAIAYWDGGPLRPGSGSAGFIGTGPPPFANIAPVLGEDPHEFPGVSETAIGMIDGFLREGGAVTNPCAPGPCLAGGWTGS